MVNSLNLESLKRLHSNTKWNSSSEISYKTGIHYEALDTLDKPDTFNAIPCTFN